MSVIFDDLGIDYSTMLSEPANFWHQVVSKAEELKRILRADNSIDSYIKTRTETDEFDFKWADAYIQDIYEYADESVPVGALKELATKFKRLARDLENLARDKASLEIADDQSLDKGIAFELYKDLRTKANEWVDAMKVMAELSPDDFCFVPEKLGSMPGNYGGNQLLIHYTFVFKNEEDKDGIPYRNPQSVCRKLGIESLNLMDLVDYIRAHPELGVIVSEQRK